MLIRSRDDLDGVDWGNGQSVRLLTDADNMGFTVAHTVVRAGTESRLQYRRHLEACYCIAGRGEVETPDGTIRPITPGTLYALDQNDAHILRADRDEDLTLVSVFNPPLTGLERHQLSGAGYSHY
ncbi:ectoine synthase [Patulibacter sp. NPDC049589]|uniref:ectoine synthase n=1 Tax=Patulibacter sp. NPDC049589 TaxID=3154731 RepID=UPI00344446C1